MYTIMYMRMVGGIRIILEMGLVVNTACLWLFVVGWCLQRVYLTICGYFHESNIVS